MIELKRNSSKTGTRPRGAKWEWYTAKVNGVMNIHIHNQTRHYRWVYEIHTITSLISKNFYDTKEDAFEAAIENAKNLLQQALKELEQ